MKLFAFKKIIIFVFLFAYSLRKKINIYLISTESDKNEKSIVK